MDYDLLVTNPPIVWLLHPFYIQLIDKFYAIHICFDIGPLVRTIASDTLFQPVRKYTTKNQ